MVAGQGSIPFAVRLLNGTVNILAVCEIESMPWDCTWMAPVNIYSPTDYADKSTTTPPAPAGGLGWIGMGFVEELEKDRDRFNTYDVIKKLP